MSAISGLMVGTQYYRGEDVPLYVSAISPSSVMSEPC